MAGWSNLAVTFALAIESTVLTASASKATSFTTALNGFADPVDLWIVLDSWMSWINEDAFVILVNTILVNPVGVKEAERLKSCTCLVFSKGLKVKLWS